jgi:anti-sigma regulatory factor (Ser/Thr protein kinase)
MRSDSNYGSECEEFTIGDLQRVRRLVAGAGRRAGVDPLATEDLVFAVNEIVINAVVYAGGHGSITVAQSPDGVRVEVRDEGPGLPADVVGDRPAPSSPSGRGLWLARGLTRRFTLSSSARGVTVRMFMPVGIADA